VNHVPPHRQFGPNATVPEIQKLVKQSMHFASKERAEVIQSDVHFADVKGSDVECFGHGIVASVSHCLATGPNLSSDSLSVVLIDQRDS
jgi:hypothetical protein